LSHQEVFLEGDDVRFLYFIASGSASFCLPSFDYAPYVRIKTGDHFGEIDIVGSAQKSGFELSEWYEKKFLLKR
jgi:hypothetical protein